MPGFEDSYKRLIEESEDWYSNDLFDHGGETFLGIARNFHPEWAGWVFVDEIKHKPDFLQLAKANSTLISLAKDFYLSRYWNPLLCEKLPYRLAHKLFDTAVNVDNHMAVIFLQNSLNYLNKNQSLYKDVVPDGVIGRRTIEAVTSMSSEANLQYLLEVYSILQGSYYVSILKRDPYQETFTRGWIRRALRI